MTITIVLLLVLAAFVLTVMSWMGKAPLAAAVFCLCIIAALGVIPLGK